MEDEDGDVAPYSIKQWIGGHIHYTLMVRPFPGAQRRKELLVRSKMNDEGNPDFFVSIPGRKA